MPPDYEQFYEEMHGNAYSQERSNFVERAEALESQARDSNGPRSVELREELVELYLARGQPMEAIWTLNEMDRREEGDALEALVRMHLLDSFAKIKSNRSLSVSGGSHRHHSLYALPGKIKVIFKLARHRVYKTRVNHRAEIAAYGIDRSLQLDVVPMTVRAKNPENEWGSLHLFVQSVGRVIYQNEEWARRRGRANLIHQVLRTSDFNQWMQRPGNYAVAIDFGAAFGRSLYRDGFSIEEGAVRERIRNTPYSQIRAGLRENFYLPTQFRFWFNYRKLINSVRE